MGNGTDIRDLPNWKYFGWGILNGLFLGISIKFKTDISTEGIFSQVLGAFISPFQEAGISTGWINASILLLGLISIISLLIEIYTIYKEGWIPRIIAFCGFVSLFLLVFDIQFGVYLLIIGCILVALFRNN